ncbi:MAG: FAD-dependent oxidoreductase, partial [Marinoscillum sp.]
SSHIAFGSIRMEPVFMILGQSAGIVAALSVEKGKELHALSYGEIKAELLQAGQVLSHVADELID